MSTRAWFPLFLGAALTAVVAFLVLPVVAIFADTAPGRLIDSLGDPAATDAADAGSATVETVRAIIGSAVRAPR